MQLRRTQYIGLAIPTAAILRKEHLSGRAHLRTYAKRVVEGPAQSRNVSCLDLSLRLSCASERP